MPRQPKNKRDDVLDNASKPSTRKAKPARKDDDDDYEDDEDLNMEELTQKVKEAKSKKKQGATEDYRQKFKEHVKKRQAEALATLLTERKLLMDKEDRADAELNAIIRSLKESPGKEQHRLYQVQQSLCALAEKIRDVHNPVQDTIKSTLDNDLKLGQDWEEASRDAVQVLGLLKQEYETKVEKEMSADTKGDKTTPGIGKAARQTEKAVRKVIKTIHIPDDDEMY